MDNGDPLIICGVQISTKQTVKRGMAKFHLLYEHFYPFPIQGVGDILNLDYLGFS